MTTDHLERLRDLPELEVPAALDQLVFERARDQLERAATPVAVSLPYPEALVYAASVTAYFAYLLRYALAAVELVWCCCFRVNPATADEVNEVALFCERGCGAGCRGARRLGSGFRRTRSERAESARALGASGAARFRCPRADRPP